MMMKWNIRQTILIQDEKECIIKIKLCEYQKLRNEKRVIFLNINIM